MTLETHVESDWQLTPGCHPQSDFSLLGIGNGVGKQGRGNRPPYRRYGPDTEIQYRLRKPHGPAKRSLILSEREDDTEFQYRPYIVDTDTIADALFADAISETSMT